MTEKHIYALLDTEDKPRYIGCSKDPKERVRLHFSSRFKKNSPVAVWLRTLDSPPGVWLIQTVPEEQGWAAERYWTELLAQVPSVDLLNIMMGTRVAESTRAILSAQRKGKPFPQVSEAGRERMRLAATGRLHDEQTREVMRLKALERERTGVNANAKLSFDDVRAIRISKETDDKLAELHGVKPNQIRRIRNGTAWRHVV